MNLNIQTNKNLLYNFLLKATLLFQIKRKTMICFSQIVDIALPQHLAFYFFIIFKSIIRLCKLPSLFGQLILLKNFKNYIIRYNFFLVFYFLSSVVRQVGQLHTYIHNIFTYSTNYSNYFFSILYFFDVSSYIIIGRM